MTAVGDHAQRRAEPPRVFEAVLEGDLPVAGPAEHEHGAADAVELVVTAGLTVAQQKFHSPA